jgi:hypothetical protein
MGLASEGGFLKFNLRDSIDDSANAGNAAVLIARVTRRVVCGNREEKRRMMWITPVCGSVAARRNAVEVIIATQPR